jgi:hypothetical protein
VQKAATQIRNAGDVSPPHLLNDEKRMVARDGIEPPTQRAFPWPRAYHGALLEERCLSLVDVMEVVARDGIEPPTPAFSGPPEATLSITYRLRTNAERPQSTWKAAESRVVNAVGIHDGVRAGRED